MEAGATYTVRASAPGFPDAEATVTVPPRVPATAATTRPDGPWIDADVRVTLRDPSGPGHRYALMVVSGPYSYPDRSSCHRNPDYQHPGDGVCPDSTLPLIHRDRSPLSFTTSDPVLLAGARTVPSGDIRFLTFTDEVFDGTERAFVVQPKAFGLATPAAVWVAAVDDRTFGAYQIAWLSNQVSGDGENPFAEPTNLPSNVVGGYGLLGAVTITEARFD